MVSGISWLKIWSGWTFRNPHPRDLRDMTDGVLLSYVRSTLQIGGLPSLVCDSLDTDAKGWLVLLGGEEVLTKIANKMVEFCDWIEETEFEEWLGRGIYLPIFL